jgi:hypothetical protein
LLADGLSLSIVSAIRNDKETQSLFRSVRIAVEKIFRIGLPQNVT